MRNSNGVIPWHLIPNKVFTVDKIPTSGGAGKVSRARVKQLVAELLNENEQSPLHDSKDSDDFDSIIGQVLGVSIDDNKSFVDHGGDSATAITLLYKLRIAGLLTNSLDTTAADIIESTTIHELKRQIRTGKFKSQRRITLLSCDNSAKLTIILLILSRDSLTFTMPSSFEPTCTRFIILTIPPMHPLLETKPRHVCISSSGAAGDGGEGFTFAGDASGGQARDGGNIDITNNESGAIQTAGTASHDIDALSVGGASSTLSRHRYICTNRPSHGGLSKLLFLS
jgi:hypothetical protein